MTYHPTDKDRRTVETMSGFGVPMPDIAQAIGISVSTLRKYFEEQLSVAPDGTTDRARALGKKERQAAAPETAGGDWGSDLNVLPFKPPA
jgi:hypothetical protein